MARVPQFGDWENGGNLPYTRHFDNARAGRGRGKPFNPNDPQDNPAAFSAGIGRGNDIDNSSPADKPGNGFHSSEEKVQAQGSQYRPTPSPTRSNYKPPAAINATPEKGRALPMFGDWDNPSAAESGGYTVIFNQVREGKQVGNAKIPVTDTQNHYYTGHGKRHDEYTNPSCFGCLFKR